MRSTKNVQITRRGAKRGHASLALFLTLITLAFTTSLTLAQAAAPVINEFSASTAGADVEYIEVYGDPSTDYSAFTLLELEGDAGTGTSTGTIDGVFPVGSTNAEGLQLINLPANELENGTLTLLLVEGFTGSLNADLDTNNDGILDTTPWTAIVDGVGVNDGGGATDFTYTAVTLTVSYDGLAFAPGGASRIPDGTDTDTTADWVRNDFDLIGIPGFVGTPVLGEAVNTPGAANQVIAPDPTLLVINEIDYDQVGGDTAEYVEIIYNGFLSVDMSGLELRLVNGASGGAVVYDTILLNGFSLASGDYFVVCANALNVPNCDLDDSPNTDFIQNGAPDAAALAFTGGAVIDTVSYEGNTSGGYTEGTGTPTTSADSNTVADLGLSRFPDGNDSGSNSADFVLSCITPGEANTDVVPPCAAPNFDFVHNIQTSGSAAAAGTFTVEAIVVADFQLDPQLDGFFIQEEDIDADALTTTSEGMFVYCQSCPVSVQVGDKVQVTGPTSEFFDMSQLSATGAGSIIVVSSDNPLPTPAALTLPIPGVPTNDLAAATAAINAYYEQYEGMLVSFPATLTVSEYFELARYGQIILSAGGRPRQFTDISTPTVAGYTAHQIDLASRQVILDDDNNAQNSTPLSGGSFFHPIPGLSISNFVRGGDTISNLTGVLHWSFAGFTGTDAWRIRPVVEEPSFNYAFTSQNLRTTQPDPVGGSLKVASFNVLNYFDTLDDDTTDDDSNDVCGPVGGMDCRGADSLIELERQGAKIAAAVCAIDADILGLIEIENDAAGALTSLVGAINSVPNCGPYTYINTGTIGTDAITTSFIYKAATVSPLGSFAALTDPAFTSPNGATIQRNRPALAQSFSQNTTGEAFTVVVNHLKSKGSGCGAGDDDTTMGQGNCNLTRTLAAQALANWLATDPTGSGDPDVLIIGDLNSYRNEDPIVALENNGFTDLNELFGGASAYSYVFDSQLGYLDYAMANASLTPQVTGVTEWHINADEFPVLDYNDEIRDAGEEAFEEEPDGLPLYQSNAYRASDHDPVIIGLNLTTPEPEYTLTVIVDPAAGGTVTVVPDQPTYHLGDIVQLHAIANVDYAFTGWTGDVDDVSLYSTLITIDEDEVVTANFLHRPYTLTVNVSPEAGGTVTVDPEQAGYNPGDVVALEAVANPGYAFTGWTGDVADTASASTTITVDEDEIVTANFTLEEYTLTVIADPAAGGTISVSPLQATYHLGDIVLLDAFANVDYAFTGWTGDVDVLNFSMAYITIDEDEVVTANFTRRGYALTVNVSPEAGGAVAVDPDQEIYNFGDVVALEAVANPGYVFTGWTGDVADTASASTTITVDEDEIVTANFVLEEYTLTVIADPAAGGTISVNPLQATYHLGDIVLLNATPNVDYVFTGWTGDVNNPGFVITTITIDEDEVVTANFTRRGYSLTVNVSPEAGGAVAVDPDQEIYNFGDVVALEAVANPGYVFTGWTGDVADTASASTTITVDEDEIVTANFAPEEIEGVVSLSLVDTKDDDVIDAFDPLTDGDVININEVGKKLSILANTDPTDVGSVKFVLTGRQRYTEIENQAPYLLFSNQGNNFLDWPHGGPDTGDYTLTVTAYERDNARGAVIGDPLTISFKIVKGPKPPVVINSFTLVNSKTDQDVAAFNPIANNAVINLAEVGYKLNIRANTTSQNVERVKFKLSGPHKRDWTEYLPPYALFSNLGGNYLDWFPRTGTYTLTATPYQKSGPPGTPLTITLTIINSQPSHLTELVDDGDFEAVSAWTIKPGSDVRFRCNSTETPTASQQVSAAGTCAMQLRGSADGAAQVQRVIVTNGLAAGQTLTLSAQIAGRNVKAKSAYLTVIVRYADGGKEVLRIRLAKGSYDYTAVNKALTLKGAVQDITLRANYAAKSGRILIDGLSLRVDGEGIMTVPDISDGQLRN